MLESTQHVRSHFITLTYAEEHLPVGGSLVPRDVQLFLKRLRSAIAPARVRYYLVGEYGEKTWRPHYHVALFGYPSPLVIGKHKECSCELCVAWSMGIVHVGEIMMESAAYVASYTLKKMTQVTDPRLAGRHPEFARMSLRPGIGALAIAQLKEALVDRNTGEIRLREFDVPAIAKSNGRLWPLGRYLRRLLRVAALGRAEEPGGVRELRNLVLQAGLLEPGAREAQERARVVSLRNAEGREKLNRSKKGIAL